MLRAFHLLSVPSPSFLLSNPRPSFSLPLPVLSSLSLPSSSRPPFPSSPPKSKPLPTPISPPPIRRWAPSSMVGNPRPQGKVQFSSGGGGGGNKEILVQHLLVTGDDLKLLIELQKKISEGVDLSDLAVEYSICPSKENGGMLGWVRKGQMVPEFEEAAFSAPLNTVVRCKTNFGWHLLQVLSEREESILEDIAPEELHSKLQDPSFIEEAQLIDVRELEEVDHASLPGFKVLPLRQFGTWGSVISDEFDPQKDTYVLCRAGPEKFNVLDKIAKCKLTVKRDVYCYYLGPLTVQKNAGPGRSPCPPWARAGPVSVSPWRAVTTGSKMVANPGIQEGLQRGRGNS